MLSASSIDLTTLPDEVAQQIAWAAEQAMSRFGAEKRWKWILSSDCSDDEIMSAAQSEFSEARRVPITLANRYDESEIDTCQEIVACYLGGRYQDYRRRPIVMRGAAKVLAVRHGFSQFHYSENGWATMVLERAIRIFKFTALSSAELEELLIPIERRLHDKFRLSYHFNRRVPGVCESSDGERGYYFVRGRRAALSRSEVSNIRSLRAIIQKTERLDQRVAAARQHFAQRMAA